MPQNASDLGLQYLPLIKVYLDTSTGSEIDMFKL